jgi:hypothetical protein
MPRLPESPTFRDFDMYGLVLVYGWRQADVALLFAVSRPRVAQVLARVRTWVDTNVGDWLFPGRDDLRFHAALDRAGIEVEQRDGGVEIMIASRHRRYRRGVTTAPAHAAAEAGHANHPAQEPRRIPLNSTLAAEHEAFATSADREATYGDCETSENSAEYSRRFAL